MSDDTPTPEEVELRRQLHRLGTAMEAAPPHSGRHVINLDGRGGGRTPRSRLVLAGAGLAAAAALVIGLTVARSPIHPQDQVTRTGAGQPSITAASTATAQTVVPMADLIGFLMPATSAEFNDGTDMALGNFLTMASAHQDAACLRHKGWSDRVANYFAHRSDRTRHDVLMSNGDFPNVAMLETGTFGTVDNSQPTAAEVAMDTAIPKDRQDAAFADLRACESQEPNPPFAMLHGATEAPVVAAVSNAYHFEGGITTEPAYVAAFANWKSCMADGGVQTTSLDDFFGQVDNVQRSDLEDAAKASRTAELAKLYGHCVEPLSHVKDTYRLAARDRAVAKYQTQLDELLTQVNQEVVKLEAEYGMTYP